MKHWHRCRRWWRLNLECPFGGFALHEDQEKEDEDDQPDDQEEEEEAKEEQEDPEPGLKLPDPIPAPARRRPPSPPPKKKEEPEPVRKPEPVPVLPPVPPAPPVLPPPGRKVVPEREVEPVPVGRVSTAMHRMERMFVRNEGDPPETIPTFRARQLDKGREIEIPDFEDKPDVEGPRVPRHPLVAFDQSIEGVPGRAGRVARVPSFAPVLVTPVIRRALAEEAVTQEIGRRMPSRSGFSVRRGLVAAVIAAGGVAGGGFLFDAGRRMRGLLSQPGGLQMD